MAVFVLLGQAKSLTSAREYILVPPYVPPEGYLRLDCTYDHSIPLGGGGLEGRGKFKLKVTHPATG
jgi:hypothetical protein